MQTTTRLLIAAGLLLLSACGYHLRGSIGEGMPEAMKAVYIEGASPQLTQALTNSLSNAKAKVTSAEQAGLRIRISRDEMRRRVLSLNQSGKATEFELDYSLEYQFLDQQGKSLLNTQVLEINRDYFNDQEDILAKNNEENVIREEIYRQAARTILARAKAVLNQ